MIERKIYHFVPQHARQVLEDRIFIKHGPLAIKVLEMIQNALA